MTTAATRLAASVDVPAGAAKADRAVRDAAVHSVGGAAYGGEDRTAQDHVDGQAAGGHDGVSECSSWCGCGECSADGSVPLDLPADPQTTFGDVRVHNTSGGTVQVGNSQTINIHTAPAGGADIVLMVPHAAGAPLRGRTPKGRLLLLSTAVPEPPAEKAAAGFSRPKRCLLWAGILCAVLTSSSALVSMLTSIASNGELANDEALIDQPADDLVWVSRREWGALPPRRTYVLPTPVATVVIEHTATASCFNKSHCCKMVALFQQYHLDDRQYDDIGYNFLVGGGGRVYQGRGWDADASRGRGWVAGAMGIAIIGHFTAQLPTAVQRTGLMRLLELGVQLGKIQPDYRLFGKCQLTRSHSPGMAFMDDLRTWEHWYNNTEENPHQCFD